MWYILKNNDATNKIYLLSGRNYKIGRHTPKSDNDISIENDQSISRLHAELLIKYDESNCTNLESEPNIVLTDNSKFGTFVNKKKIEGFQNLRQSDQITFGTNTAIYTLCNEPMIVTTSCVSTNLKNTIKKSVAKLCGHMINDWQNHCSFVVMESLTVTVKVVDALICQKHVITNKYLDDVIEAIEMKKNELPDPQDYLPPISEPLLKSKVVDFSPCVSRKSLFEGRRFVFFSEDQLQKMKNIVELTSGECEVFKKTVHLNQRAFHKNADSFIFIRNTDLKSKQLEQLQSQLQTFLNELNLKLVDESEIGLAIIFSNLDEYCNTAKKVEKKARSERISKLGSQTQSDSIASTFETNHRVRGVMTDSLALQIEDKVDDMMIVVDTPEKDQRKSSRIINLNASSASKKEQTTNRTKLNLSTSSNSNFNNTTSLEKSSSNDFDALKDDFEFKVTDKKKKNDTVKPSAKLASLLEDDDSAMDAVDESELLTVPDDVVCVAASSFPANKPSTRSKVRPTQHCINLVDEEPAPFDSFQKENLNLNQGSIVKTEVVDGSVVPLSSNIMKAKGVKTEKRIPSSSDLNISGVIYTKFKPPPESIKIKDEVKDEYNGSYSKARAKVHFESLIKVKKEPQVSLTPGSSRVVNFKKFHKVPKASQSQQRNGAAAGGSQFFRSFKNEPFDVNSQFEIFISSAK